MYDTNLACFSCLCPKGSRNMADGHRSCRPQEKILWACSLDLEGLCRESLAPLRKIPSWLSCKQ